MKTICERCSRSFLAAPKCPHCETSAEIQDGDQQVRPIWGWATISLNEDEISCGTHSHQMKSVWLRLEEFTVMRLLNSQAAVFDEGGHDTSVLIKQDLLAGLIDQIELLCPRVSVSFEPIDGDFGNAAALNALLVSRSTQ